MCIYNIFFSAVLTSGKICRSRTDYSKSCDEPYEKTARFAGRKLSTAGANP